MDKNTTSMMLGDISIHFGKDLYYCNHMVKSDNYGIRSHASKLSLLFDSELYYRKFAELAEQADETIYIIGWEIDSRVALIREKEKKIKFYNFLNDLTKKNPALNIYILIWDYAPIYILERQMFSKFFLKWKGNHRIHFVYDDEHPIGASHHEKIVVIDDNIAFIGGIDVTKRRWDTSSHIFKDQRRTDPDGKYYTPYHDMQVLIDGEAAEELGNIARERWERACDKKIYIPKKTHKSIWPEDIKPDFRDINVTFSRTMAKYKSNPEVTEIEKLYRDNIKAAKDYIYIENQFFSSKSISDYIADSLRKKEGPEVIIILPKYSGAWLEKSTMGRIRSKMLSKIIEADKYERLRLYYPVITKDDEEEVIKIHSKIMIIDNKFVTIGSANISNRSMGLDTECNISFDATSEVMSEKISLIRNTLAGEHIGYTVDEIEKDYSRFKSLKKTIENRRKGSERKLRLMKPDIEKVPVPIPVNEDYLDPPRPGELDIALDQYAVGEEKKKKIFYFVKFFGIFFFLILMAILWRYTPLSEKIDFDSLVESARIIEHDRLASLYVLSAYVVGGLLVFPVTILIVVTSLVFSTTESIIYALAGSQLSAACLYVVGRIFGVSLLEYIDNKYIKKLHSLLKNNVIYSLAFTRIVPVAPYSIINFICGSIKLKFWRFMMGSVIGISPGIVVISLFTNRLLATFRNPDIVNIIIISLLTIVIFLGIWWIKKRLRVKKTDNKN